MNIRDLIDSIESGKTLDVENAFQSIMAEKVATRLADMRMQVAKNMFATNESVESEEEQVFITQEEYDALSEEEKAEYSLVEDKDKDDDEDEDEDDDEGDDDDEDEDDKKKKYKK